MTRFRKGFVVDGSYNIDIPPDLPLRSGFFGILPTIRGTEYEFNFTWVGRPDPPFYLIDVFRGPERIARHMTRRGTSSTLIRNFFDSALSPDARLYVIDVPDDDDLVTPESLSSGDHIVKLQTGVIER